MLNMKQGSPIEIKAVSDAGAIEGYGSTFGNVDNGLDVVEKGAFVESLKDRGLPKMLWGHDLWQPPIGRWDEAKEDDTGLMLKGQLNLDMQMGREVHSALTHKSVDGLSIGFLIKEADFEKNGVRKIKKVDLFEVSVVTFPMNESARVDTVKQFIESGLTERQLEGILRDVGFSRKQARGLIARGYEGLISQRDADDGLDELAGIISGISKTMRI